jgi:hypothetical protein
LIIAKNGHDSDLLGMAHAFFIFTFLSAQTLMVFTLFVTFVFLIY